MKKLLRVFIITAIALTFIGTWNVTQDIEWYEMVVYTVAISSTINFLIELVLVVRLRKKYDRKVTYALHVENGLTETKAELVLERKAHIETESALECEITEHSKCKQRLDKLLEIDKATIKIGDKVTSVARLKPSNVYAMKLGNGIEYQLARNGKWYSANEIRKIA